MKEKKVASLKIVFEDGSDYSVACDGGLDKDELAKYIERAFKPEPAEPLIKDEKIRKAVRAWAEALGQREQFLCIKNGTRLEVSDGSPHLLYISFWADKSTLDSIDDRTYYTIAELCGEEEG